MEWDRRLCKKYGVPHTRLCLLLDLQRRIRRLRRTRTVLYFTAQLSTARHNNAPGINPRLAILALWMHLQCAGHELFWRAGHSTGSRSYQQTSKGTCYRAILRRVVNVMLARPATTKHCFLLVGAAVSSVQPYAIAGGITARQHQH